MTMNSFKWQLAACNFGINTTSIITNKLFDSRGDTLCVLSLWSNSIKWMKPHIVWRNHLCIRRLRVFTLSSNAILRGDKGKLLIFEFVLGENDGIFDKFDLWCQHLVFGHCGELNIVLCHPFVCNQVLYLINWF